MPDLSLPPSLRTSNVVQYNICIFIFFSMSTNVEEYVTDTSKRYLLAELLRYVHVVGQIDHYMHSNDNLLCKINEELSGLASTNILVKSVKVLITDNEKTCIEGKMSAAIEVAPYFMEPPVSGFVWPNPTNPATASADHAGSNFIIKNVEDEKMTSLLMAILSLRFEMRSRCAHELADYLRRQSHINYVDDAKIIYDGITELIKYGLC
uniref:Uncharacterized protein n=1 Tax=Glypta fumiferanae TaxID=389681 RepID=A0A0F6Q8A3_9HYME|nr:hypothetical protein [Glypta fumiferanae]